MKLYITNWLIKLKFLILNEIHYHKKKNAKEKANFKGVTFSAQKENP